MKVAIIGAGFGGLAAAIELQKLGHQVTVFEADKKPGGLAVGFKQRNWGWSLENFYHHIFTTDREIIELAREVGSPAIFDTPQTCIYRRGKISRFDSPQSLFTSPELSVWGKLRLGGGLAALKLLPSSLAIYLERYTTKKVLPLIVGQEGFDKIWQPLLTAKFGPYVNQVNLAWFWARVAKRSTALGYFEGGFQALAEAMVDHVKLHRGQIKLKHPVKKIKSDMSGVSVDGVKFDRLLLTVPAPLVDKLIGQLVDWPKINYLWGQTLVIETTQSLMDSYWLNILEKRWPFLVAVEHTNFVSKDHYGKHRLIYLGNYLPDGDRRLKLGEKGLLKLFWPYLKKINPKLDQKNVVGLTKFQAPFAQPVFPTNYSHQLPPVSTADPNIFIANMSQVYPFDRGTNYAVQLGQRAARLIASVPQTY